MLRALALAIVALCLTGVFLFGASVAYAGPRQQTVITCDERGCNDTVASRSGNGRDSGRVASGLGAGRPVGCPSLWCGCWARLQAGITDTRYNLAKNWLAFRHVAGRGAAPVVGSWAVMGRRGGGHVGIVTGVDASGNPIIKSGNHNRRVGEAVYPRGRILAYVMP